MLVKSHGSIAVYDFMTNAAVSDCLISAAMP